MPGKYRLTAYLCLLTALMLPASAPVSANLVFTLTQHTIRANPGQTITFSGRLRNTGDLPLYLNSDFGIVDQPLSIDDTKFLTTFELPSPQPTLAAHGAPITAELFDVSLPADKSLYIGRPTTFNGSFTIYGGATPSDSAELGMQHFTISTSNVAVPEVPGLDLLVFVGAGAYLILRPRRRG